MKKKVICIIQARILSSRLPGKIFLSGEKNQSLLEHNDINLFSIFKSMIFINKRKKISTILKKHKFNIDNLTHLDMRAEEYDLNEFVSMYKKLKPELINKFC